MRNKSNVWSIYGDFDLQQYVDAPRDISGVKQDKGATTQNSIGPMRIPSSFPWGVRRVARKNTVLKSKKVDEDKIQHDNLAGIPPAMMLVR